MKTIVALTLIIFLYGWPAAAQQKSRLNYKEGLNKYDQPAYMLFGQQIYIPQTALGPVAFLLQGNPQITLAKSKGSGNSISRGFIFDRCTLVQTALQDADYVPKNFTRVPFLKITNSAFQGEFQLNHLEVPEQEYSPQNDEGIEISNSQTSELLFLKVYSKVDFFANKSDVINIEDSKIKLNFYDVGIGKESMFFLRSYKSRISVSNLSPQGYVGKTRSKGLSFRSDTDTLGSIDLYFRGATTNNISLEKDIFLRKSIYSFSGATSSNSNLLIYDCRFQDKTTLELNEVDTLILSDNQIDSTLRLMITATEKKPLVLMLYRTNLDKIDFEFNEFIHVTPYDRDNPDEMSLTYQALLEKFKSEGREISYQHVDIQYKQYQYNHYGSIGTLLSFISRIWWNYGYDKPRIIYITILSLILFFIGNLLLWKRLKNFYPIFTKPPIKHTSRFSAGANRLVVIFIFTIFIFFSLRIDMGKLQPGRTRLMLYFFIQYFFGMICLLFLFGAILKF